MNLAKSLAVIAVALAGCGENRVNPDAAFYHDSGNLDTPSFPPPPTIGTQIDRVGRDAISKLLVGVFAFTDPEKTAQQDAYDLAPDPATWLTTKLANSVAIERELELNIAVFDAIDTGMAVPGAGCGNGMRYTAPPSPLSYQSAADLIGDDRLYVDTAKSTCNVYLALEIEQVIGGFPAHTSCGGRTLTHDAIDVTYSMLAAGTDGLDRANDFAPKLHDGVAAHTDVRTTFPFLGAPH